MGMKSVELITKMLCIHTTAHSRLTFLLLLRDVWCRPEISTRNISGDKQSVFDSFESYELFFFVYRFLLPFTFLQGEVEMSFLHQSPSLFYFSCPIFFQLSATRLSTCRIQMDIFSANEKFIIEISFYCLRHKSFCFLFQMKIYLFFVSIFRQ